MHLSFAEMMRTSVDALRGFGVSFGEADDAVECLLLTQCALAKGYELLREADAGPRPTERTSMDVSGEIHTTIDLKGRSMLFAAARIADYAATRNSGSVIRVRGSQGRWALPYLVHRVVGHGRAVAAAWSDTARSAGIVALGTPSGGTPMAFWSSDIGTWPSAAAFVGRQSPELRGSEACIVIGERAAENVLDPIAAPNGMRRLDFAAAKRTAILDGLTVDRADQAFYQTLVRRIRVPTSERSRTQAG